MASAVKFKMGDLLNLLLAHPSAITRQERHASSETARQPSRIASENERKVTRKSVYLTRRAAEVLVETAREEVESESHIASSALIFYAERGAYIEELIRQSVKEAFREFNPATTRRRVLIKSRSVNGSTREMIVSE